MARSWHDKRGQVAYRGACHRLGRGAVLILVAGLDSSRALQHDPTPVARGEQPRVHDPPCQHELRHSTPIDY
jgi:hypothetical protein